MLSINEIAFRINSILLNSPIIKRQIDEILNSINIKIENSHLLIDHQSIYDNINSIKSYTDINQFIPYIDRWKTYSLIGGSFPKDLCNFKSNTNITIPRLEWINYKLSVEDNLKRIPTFGDYTIQYGNYIEFTKDETKQLNPSANIRYTTNDSWEILKGEWIKNPKGSGYYQFPALAQLLISNDQVFYGDKYSSGDKYIYEIAQQKFGSSIHYKTGNIEKYLYAGINHHLTLVNDQIIDFF